MPQPPMKHVLDDLLSIPHGTVTDQVINLAVGTVNPDPYTTNNAVKNGSIIGTMSLQLDVYLDQNYDAGQTACLFDWYVGFNINGQQTMPNPNNVGASHVKNQIFHQDQGVLEVSAQAANVAVRPPKPLVWRVQIAIPRLYHQVNEGDVIEFHIIKSVMSTADLNVKLKCIYKEYYP